MAKQLTLTLAAGTLALASAALAMPGPSGEYRAAGTEPFWGLRIGGGRMVYSSPDQPSVSVATPRPRAIRNGRRYATSRLTVEITREGACNDGMSERYSAETVRLWFGRRTGRTLEGCGGAAVPPPTLTGSQWRIVAIGGRPVSGDNYILEFSEGRLSGQAGCNRFSGPYSETRPTLRPGAIAATRMACPGAAMDNERRALRILAGPLAMVFPDGDTLVLSGRGGAMRLRRNY